jgi:hypothetical protein
MSSRNDHHSRNSMSHYKHHIKTIAVALVAWFVVGTSCAPASESPGQTTAASTECAGAEPSPTRYLRQLSLDLLGRSPTPAEYLEVTTRGEVAPSTIDRILNSPEFVERVKGWHADLLWPSIKGFDFSVGGRLVVEYLAASNINPEWLVEAMDRRTDEATCPAAGTRENLTAASCCTPSNPNHPSCCLVRNTTYNPADPACVAKSAALPATFSYGTGLGDRHLRGGDRYLGCDSNLEYPPARVSASETRWTHDSAGRPYYTSPITNRRRYYYDDRDVPLPYQDVTHCPNYCRTARGSGAGGAFTRNDYVGKTRLIAGVATVGDGPGYACPAGYVEVVNPCDNTVEARPTSLYEIRREGWRLMQPYWAGGHWVKTCAYDAQDRAESVSTRQLCRPGSNVDSSCGCGPMGMSCSPFSGEYGRWTHTLEHLIESINREPLEIVGSVVAHDEDYSNIFTTHRSLANGALSFMNRYQTDQVGELDFSPSAPQDALPDVPYTDDTWHEYQRSPEHSGILTTPVYLARFGTVRSRINRFRTAFLCRPFSPSADPPPPIEHPCNRETNLARRCGCQHCHASIEPLGAAWGRWAERSTNYLDPLRFPSYDPACASCTGVQCPRRCRSYVTTPTDGDSVPFLGTLETYLYRSPEEIRRIEQGPSSIIADTLRSGELQSCTARTTWARLLNRPMSLTEQTQVLPALIRQFDTEHRSYRALVRAIVTSPAYRRIN